VSGEAAGRLAPNLLKARAKGTNYGKESFMSLILVGGVIGWLVLAALMLRGNGFARSPQEGGQGGAIG
jgi:hypothetical protein